MSAFYKMDPAAWDFGTAKLTLEQEAAYLRIVNAIHKHDSPVPHDDRVLAGMFRSSTRKARTLLAALVEAGKLQIEDGWIWNERARSDMVRRGFTSISRAEAGAKGGRARANAADKPLTGNDLHQANASSRIEKNRIEKNPPTPLRGKHPRFEEFWDAFGDKRARPAAEKAFVKAAKDTDPDVIIAGAKRYAATRGPERRFWKMAQGWLNDRRWEDAAPEETKVESWMDGMGIKRDADPSGPRGGTRHPDAARGEQPTAMSGVQRDAEEATRPLPQRDGGRGWAGGPLLALRAFEGCEV